MNRHLLSSDRALMTEQRWGPVQVQPDVSASLIGVPYRITREGFLEMYGNLGQLNHSRVALPLQQPLTTYVFIILIDPIN